jgi:hypothetical protein
MQTMTIQGEVDATGRLKLDVPTRLPRGMVDVVLVVHPARARGQYDFTDLVGRFTWKGDVLAEQRRMRDEW